MSFIKVGTPEREAWRAAREAQLRQAMMARRYEARRAVMLRVREKLHGPQAATAPQKATATPRPRAGINFLFPRLPHCELAIRFPIYFAHWLDQCKLACPRRPVRRMQ